MVAQSDIPQITALNEEYQTNNVALEIYGLAGGQIKTLVVGRPNVEGQLPTVGITINAAQLPGQQYLREELLPLINVRQYLIRQELQRLGVTIDATPEQAQAQEAAFKKVGKRK